MLVQLSCVLIPVTPIVYFCLGRLLPSFSFNENRKKKAKCARRTARMYSACRITLLVKSSHFTICKLQQRPMFWPHTTRLRYGSTASLSTMKSTYERQQCQYEIIFQYFLVQEPHCIENSDNTWRSRRYWIKFCQATYILSCHY